MKYGAWASDHLKTVVEQRYIVRYKYLVSYDVLEIYPCTLLQRIAETPQFIKYSNSTHQPNR